MRKIPEIVQELKKMEEYGLLESNNNDNFMEKITKIENVNFREDQTCDTTIFKNTNIIDNSHLENFKHDLSEIINKGRIIFDISPESILFTDNKGTILEANNKFCNWLGYNRNDIINDNFFEIPCYLNENEKHSLISIYQNPENSIMTSIELVFITNNKERRYGLIHLSSIKDPKERFIGMLIMISDITDIKTDKNEFNNLRQLHENVIENANIWLSVMDIQSNVIIWNKAAENITGYSREEVIGKNKIWELLKPDEDQYNNHVNTKGNYCVNGVVVSESYETIIKRKDGNIRTISWNSRVIKDSMNNPIGNIVLGQDITEQKEFEREIQDKNAELGLLNKDLEQRVQERTNEIKRLLKQKNEFINQLSHDLKTPLTPLMILLPILEKKTGSKKDKELFEVSIRNVFFMNDLIHKTIDLAKLNSNNIKFSFEPLDLKNEILAVIKNNQVLFKKNNIKIVNKVASNIIVQADKLQLGEILNNLLTNAVKYIPDKGGEIIINAEKNQDTITVSIKDSGIGMNSDQLGLIFNEFYKADESRHKLDSSGLGLTITKKIIEKHGGKIWAESKGEGKGSTFFFTLHNAKEISKK